MITDTMELILKTIENLPDEQAADYEFSRRVTNLLSKKRSDWVSSGEYAEKLKQQARKNEQRRDAIKEKERLVAEWVTHNLKHGMVVKMSGTRDGHGLRLVERVSFDQVICRQMKFYKRVDSPAGHRVLPADVHVVKIEKGLYIGSDQITTHGVEKVNKVYSFDGLVTVDGRHVNNCVLNPQPF